MSRLYELSERVADLAWLDSVGAVLQATTSPMLRPVSVRNLLNGTWLGHPLHPLMIVLPLGSWVSSGVLDLLGGAQAEDSADGLVALGVATAVPTAAAGAAQWVDTTGQARRIGAAHALANTFALGLQATSVLLRRRGRRGSAKALSLTALGVVSVAGYLGGHLSYAHGVGVNHTAFDQGPKDWTWTSVSADDVREGELRYTDVEDREVVLSRVDGQVVAYNARCTHAGGPLHKGTVEDGCVRCPWHASVFDLRDGTVVEGPATVPQPRYEVRLSGGTIEIRQA